MPDPNNLALPEHGIVFMLLPKVANTSIKRAILTAQGRQADNVHDPALFTYVDKAEAARYPLRIGFVRDPLTRLASCWRDKIMDLSDGALLPGFAAIGLRAGMPFDEFVEFVAGRPDAECTSAAQHFRSQAWSLAADGSVIPNLMGRFETLADDWRRVRRAVAERGGPGLPDLPHERRSDSASAPWTPRARAFALHRYREDVRLFGYAPARKHAIDPDAETRGRSICNVHREAYRLARDRVADRDVSAALCDLIGEAFDMGKRMNAALGRSQYE